MNANTKRKEVKSKTVEKSKASPCDRTVTSCRSKIGKLDLPGTYVSTKGGNSAYEDCKPVQS